MSMKKKFLKEIYKLLGESDDGNTRSPVVSPDVVDLAGLLRSCGFRVRKVDLKPSARACPPPGGSKASCSVQLTCTLSGLNIILESEGDCRCPEAATLGDDSVSTWIVETPVSPSCSQENLSKSEQAGCSLLPEVPAAAAEVVSVAVACIMKVIGEERVAKKAGNAASRSTSVKKTLRPSLSAESNLKDLAQHGRSNTDLLQTRSLDDMDLEAVAKNIAPSFQELSISSISSISKSEELLAIAPQPSRIATLEGSTQPFGSAANDMPPPPRRQSSTLEDYLKFEANLSDNNCVVTPSRTSTESYSSGASACRACNPQRTKEMLEKAQTVRLKLDELVQSLKQCARITGVSTYPQASSEAASAVGSRKKTTQIKSKVASSATPLKTETPKQLPRPTTKAAILQTLRRETAAMPASQAGTPRPLQTRRSKAPSPLPRTISLQYSPFTPSPRPGPTNLIPRPTQVQRRLPVASSSSGASSLPFLPGSTSSLSGYSESGSSSNITPRRQSDGIPRKQYHGIRPLMDPRKKPK